MLGPSNLDPGVRGALVAALAPVHAVEDRPLADHAAAYEAAHRALLQVLQAGAPGAGPR